MCSDDSYNESGNFIAGQADHMSHQHMMDAFLLALASNPTDKTPLTFDEEGALDNFIQGSLKEDAVIRVSQLIKTKIEAREHILAHQLNYAAIASPMPSAEVSSKILSLYSIKDNPQDYEAGPSYLFSNIRLIFAAGFVSMAAAILLITSQPTLFRESVDGPSFQVAMADIPNRNELFESSDFITRGTNANDKIKKSLADLDLPASLIIELSKASKSSFDSHNYPQMQNNLLIKHKVLFDQLNLKHCVVYLDNILLDRALKHPENDVHVRVFDLNEPSNSSLKNSIAADPSKNILLFAERPEL